MPFLESRLDNGAIPWGDLSEREASEAPPESNRPANPASVHHSRGNRFCSNASIAEHVRLFRHLNFLSYLYESRSQSRWPQPSRPVWSVMPYFFRYELNRLRLAILQGARHVSNALLPVQRDGFQIQPGG